MLITFEGGEGAGKTTLIHHVSQYLATRGIAAIETREPGGTALGSHMRHLVLTADSNIAICPMAELMLYMTSRAQIIEEVISPALTAGNIVLCDRFNDSTIVYQGAARGLDASEVQRICTFVCKGMTPHLTFYLDLDPSIGLSRTKMRGIADRIESEALIFHQKVRQAYLKLAAQEPNRIVLIDASLSILEVWLQAEKVLEACLQKS